MLFTWFLWFVNGFKCSFTVRQSDSQKVCVCCKTVYTEVEQDRQKDRQTGRDRQTSIPGTVSGFGGIYRSVAAAFGQF